MQTFSTIAKFALAFVIAIASLTQSFAERQKRYFDHISGTWKEYNAVSRKSRHVERQVVKFETKHKPGTILVKTGERRAYFILPGGKAMRYAIAVGREGFGFSGTFRLTRKAEWPSWTPPASMHRRIPGLPKFMPGGPKNPMGARALYVGNTLYRLHGTNEPWSIGRNVSSGCIRFLNADIIDLYKRAKIGAKIIVT